MMEKVDANGNVLGFPVMKVNSLKGKPFEVALARNSSGYLSAGNEMCFWMDAGCDRSALPHWALDIFPVLSPVSLFVS
ncbi:hypothetical protein BH23ACT11_BH23ACT11_15820 [soil metagenome]